MAGVATLAQGLVLEDKRPALHGVALETGLISPSHLRPAALYRRTFVRVMAIGTTHLAFQHGMVVRERELRTDIEVALEAGLRGASRIDNGTPAATSLDVLTARPVTRFATNVLAAITGQPRVGRGVEIPRLVFVARLAAFRSNECCAGNARRRHERARSATGNKNESERCSGTDRPPEFFAPAVEPSS